jgi:hypothetical protein
MQQLCPCTEPYQEVAVHQHEVAVHQQQQLRWQEGREQGGWVWCSWGCGPVLDDNQQQP